MLLYTLQNRSEGTNFWARIEAIGPYLATSLGMEDKVHTPPGKRFIRGLLSVMALGLIFQSAKTLAGAKETVGQRLRSATLSVDTDIIDIGYDDIISAGLNVGVKVKQNRDKVTYSREELYMPKGRIGDWSGGVDGDVDPFAYIDAEAGITFIRQFDRHQDALNVVRYTPYGFDKLPTTAERAMNLVVGDYVRFKTRLAATIGAGTAETLGVMQANGAVRYMLDGDFQLEIYKVSETDYLLRASALKQDTVSLDLKYNTTDALRIIPIKEGASTIEGKARDLLNDFLVPSSILSGRMFEVEGNLLTIEYIYRFSHPEDPGARAFERVVNSDEWIKDGYKIITKHIESEKFNSTMVARFDLSERMVEEVPKSCLEFCVRRNSRSTSEFTNRGWKIKMDLRAVEGHLGKTYVEQDFKVQDSEGHWSRFLIANLVKSFKLDFIKLLGLEVRGEANIVFTKTPEGLIDQFMHLGFHYLRDERTQTNQEVKRIQQQINRMMPPEYHEDLKLDRLAKSLPEDDPYWDDFKDGFIEKDTRVEAELYFHPEAWRLLSQMHIHEVRRALEPIYDEFAADQDSGARAINKKYGIIQADNSHASGKGPWRDRARQYLAQYRLVPHPDYPNDEDKKLKQFIGNSISTRLGRIFGRGALINRKDDQYENLGQQAKSGFKTLLRTGQWTLKTARPVNNEDRWNDFKMLRHNQVFYQIGPGILARLLEYARKKYAPHKEFGDYATFVLRTTVADIGTRTVTFGDYEQSEAVKNLLRARDRILGRDFDPQYFQEAGTPTIINPGVQTEVVDTRTGEVRIENPKPPEGAKVKFTLAPKEKRGTIFTRLRGNQDRGPKGPIIPQPGEDR